MLRLHTSFKCCSPKLNHLRYLDTALTWWLIVSLLHSYAMPIICTLSSNSTREKVLISPSHYSDDGNRTQIMWIVDDSLLFLYRCC
jgi:hypothetical protein